MSFQQCSLKDHFVIRECTDYMSLHNMVINDYFPRRVQSKLMITIGKSHNTRQSTANHQFLGGRC